MRIGLTGIFVDDQDHAKDAQQLYMVPASDLVLGRLDRDVDDRHWPGCSATWPGGWTSRAQARRHDP
jgi:hypothetical protein